MRALLALCLLLSFAFSACESDESGDLVQPDPVVLADSVVFTVRTLDGDGSWRVRWIGDENGPLDISPEGTSHPWIGFGRAFEISWEAWSKEGRVTGYQWKASQYSTTPFLPRDENGNAQFAADSSVFLSNDTDNPGSFSCPDGLDCPTIWRWESNLEPYLFRIRARDEMGNTTEHGLGFFVNYPPTTEWLVRGSGCGDFSAVPRLELVDGEGNLQACVFAEDDTVSGGAYLVLGGIGSDRLVDTSPSGALDDSFCCDYKLDPAAPEVRMQYRVWFETEPFDGVPLEYVTFWSDAVDDTLGFITGPFDMLLQVRAVDEHGRPDPEPRSWRVVGGFEPRLVSVTPADGDFALLRHPDATEPWPQNTIEVEVERNASRYWIPDVGRYWDEAIPGSMTVSGTAYHLPMRFESAAHPSESTREWVGAGEAFSGGVRSWTYEVRAERDPTNSIADGDGFDRWGTYQRAGANGVWDMENGLSVFVPDAFWSDPEAFDPDGACDVPMFCQMGEVLQRQLGRAQLRVKGITSVPTSDYTLFMSTLRPASESTMQEIELDELGRGTEVAEVEFECYVGLEVEGSTNPVLWPAPTVSPSPGLFRPGTPRN